MTLGELMEALESYRANTIGVDEDTKVQIVVEDAGVTAQLEDAVVTLRMTSTGYGGRRNEATIVLEATEA